MGRAGSIHKHTSHLTLELDQIKPQDTHGKHEGKADVKKTESEVKEKVKSKKVKVQSKSKKLKK